MGWMSVRRLGRSPKGGVDEPAVDHEYAREMCYPAGRHADEVFAIPASAISESSRLS